MNKLFGYARVSTLDQNLDTQLDALQKAGCDDIFQDKITGVSTSRPALDTLLAQLRPGDTVMVARFFRLGRSRDHLIACWTSLPGKVFTSRHWTWVLIVVHQPVNWFCRSLPPWLNMMAPATRRESILEKTRAGQLLAKAKGKHIGRPAGLDAEKFAKVKKALERGLSVAEIVSLRGISISSVKRYRKQIEKTIDQLTISK
jgi:DNA invertase Pin-like site-specific DNA recombinase